MPETLASRADGHDLTVGVLVARWYPEVTDALRDAALATLAAAGVKDDDVLVVEVPGAFELPQAAGWLARRDGVDAIVALGCVVRGETPHFDYVCASCSQGLMQVGLESGLPIGFGVITADSAEQALARAGDATGKGGNKGTEAADAAVRMAATYKALEARRR